MTSTSKNLGDDWEYIDQHDWADLPTSNEQKLREGVKRLIERGLLRPTSVSLRKSGDYIDPIKQAETFSGTLEFDIEIPLVWYGKHEEIRSEIRKQMTEALMIWGLEKEERGVRTEGGYPNFFTEIFSHLEGEYFHHRVKAGVTFPNPKGYTAPQCLDVYAHHIAVALCCMLPDKYEMAMTAKPERTLYKICDADFVDGPDPEALDVREIETRTIPRSIS